MRRNASVNREPQVLPFTKGLDLLKLTSFLARAKIDQISQQNKIKFLYLRYMNKCIKPWNWWRMTRRRRVLSRFLSHTIIVVQKANWMVCHISFFWSFNVRENRGRQHIWVREIRFPCFVCTTLLCIVPKILLLLLLCVQIIEIALLGRRWLIWGQVGLLAHCSESACSSLPIPLQSWLFHTSLHLTSA